MYDNLVRTIVPMTIEIQFNLFSRLSPGTKIGTKLNYWSHNNRYSVVVPRKNIRLEFDPTRREREITVSGNIATINFKSLSSAQKFFVTKGEYIPTGIGRDWNQKISANNNAETRII